MSYQETGRQYLSPGILRIVDNNGIPYTEMQSGQVLTIHAQDAESRQPSQFSLEVLSVREEDPRRHKKTATLRYREGEFTFYDADDPTNKVRLEPGTLMENGVSATLLPQPNMTIVYMGGIGLGRDHSFEYVDGTTKGLITHRLEAIDVVEAPQGYQAPDISGHLRKIEATKRAQKEAEENRGDDIDRAVIEDMRILREHPEYEKMEEMIRSFSPNGKLVMSYYLTNAHEDGVLDKAWQLLQQAYKEQFKYDHPMIRGDLDFKASNRIVFERMLRESGITWPRPGKSE